MRMNLLFAETLRKLRIEKGRVSALTQSPTPFLPPSYAVTFKASAAALNASTVIPIFLAACSIVMTPS